MADEPNKGGRPTLYDPAHCEVVVEAGKAGKSVAWIACELGVCKQTLHNWMEAHPEFLDAMTRAKLFAQRWWEDKGQDGLTQSGFNASIWSRSMAARFPEDWRETTRQEQTGKDGGAIEQRLLVTREIKRAPDHTDG
jgi:predicted transcriptional regulator